MAGYWPTAADHDPIVTLRMNATPKLVFSKTLKTVEWQNSRLATGSIPEEVARLKQGSGFLWVGGTTLATSFLELGLIDEIRVILTPILLRGGNTVFGGIRQRHELRLVSTRSFNYGSAVATYRADAGGYPLTPISVSRRYSSIA
jgi:dihydrofolate reductase